MEGLPSELLAVLLEILGEFLLELFVELAAESLGGRVKYRKERHPAISAVGLAVAGTAAGFLSTLLFPHPLMATRLTLPGASLVLAPPATGAVMHLMGTRLRSKRRTTTRLATFWGGALFAFSMALMRWWLVGLAR